MELIQIDWELESYRHSMWNYLQDMIEKGESGIELQSEEVS